MEGMHCYVNNCNTQGLTLPVAEYPHTLGCSVSGGVVYRGRSSPGLRGIYVYGDYCSGRIWGIERQGNAWVNRLLLASGFGITTFGEDEAGELYVADATGGAIYHIEGSRAPRFSAAGVVNAASFVQGIAPGSLVTLFGAGILDDPGVLNAPGIPVSATLGGVSVTMNGVNAPMLLIANRNGQEQINLQAPFELRGRASAQVVVTRDGLPSGVADVPIVDIQPAIFTNDGTDAVVIHNADYTLATAQRPLIPGEYAFIYATGLGPAGNEPATGAGAPQSPLASVAGDVRVTLAGKQCELEYAGLAPSLVGIYQVNFRVPESVASGAQDLVIVATTSTSPKVKVQVQ